MSEKRINRQDGVAYTWEEFLKNYSCGHTAEQIATYWQTCEVSAIKCGLITDVQYGPFKNKGKRRYGHSLSVLRNAVSFFKEQRVDFAAHVGDLVDWRNSTFDDDRVSRQALSDIRSILCTHELEWCCLLGNHELYNFERRGDVLTRQPFVPVPAAGGKNYSIVAPCATALQELGAGERAYYSFKPRSDMPWRFVVLDPFDESAMSHGRDLSSSNHPGAQHYTDEEALERGDRAIEAICPEEELRAGPAAPPAVRRFAKRGQSTCCDMNGAIGVQQYRWLQAELEASTLKEERVIILSHVILSQRPTGEDQSKEMCSLWNFPTLVRLFHSPIGRCVAACIHGHDHEGGYWQDPTGLHTIVLQASLEAEGDTGPFVVLEVYSDLLVFRGYENNHLFGEEAAVQDGERRRELTVRPLKADEDEVCECEWCRVAASEDRWWE